MTGSILTRTHLIIVVVAALLVLGPKRLRAAGRGLGEAMRGFKDGVTRDEQSQVAVEPTNSGDSKWCDGCVDLEVGTLDGEEQIDAFEIRAARSPADSREPLGSRAGG